MAAAQRFNLFPLQAFLAHLPVSLIYEEKQNAYHPDPQINTQAPAEKNTMERLDRSAVRVQAMFRSMKAQDDEAHREHLDRSAVRVHAMFRSMKAQDDEAHRVFVYGVMHLEYEFARYLVRMAAMRCESKRIWRRDYINGKASQT
ncbi:hypothetical protein F2Q70_00012384 [Brassica cretica]|uniref:Uncharacterized protein n=1 Tax=Brassica cretica TaxID=69181 RepID=A0A8S9M3G9_BRACR|nr:hypothetical protein F2Q70_00012384 [Brassica cretica]